MRLAAAILVVLGICLNPLASADDGACAASADAVSLCAVASNAANYDGKEINVGGLYRMVIHGSVLIGSACSKVQANLRGAPDYKENKRASAVIRSFTKKNQFQTVDVVIRGTFRVAHEGRCFGQNCEIYEIEDHGVMCAAKP